MNRFNQYAESFLLNIIIPLGITLIAFLVAKSSLPAIEISSTTSEEIKVYHSLINAIIETFQWVIAIFIGVLSYFIVYSITHKYTHEKFNFELNRKLVDTNAVIKNPETKKIAITAKELDFYEKKVYDEIETYKPEEKKAAESIDILRWYSFQDLLFTPRYLDYFFNRGTQIGKPTRLIIIEDVCLATISFIFLSLRANYETYIISNKKFKEYCCKIKVSQQKVLKGNPYLIKIQNDIKYGKFSNGSDIAKDIRNKDEIWAVCEKLIYDNSGFIKTTRDTFSIKEIKDYLHEIDKDEVKA